MTDGKNLITESRAFVNSKGSLAPVINVLEFGARKYSEDNWRKVANAETRYFDADHRHLNAWWDGQTLDPETGESHLAHAVSCLLFILALEQEKSLSRPICSTCGFAPCECKQTLANTDTYRPLRNSYSVEWGVDMTNPINILALKNAQNIFGRMTQMALAKPAYAVAFPRIFYVRHRPNLPTRF